MYLGAHVSIAGGYLTAARDAHAIGANTFACFTRNPRGGKARDLDERECAALCDFAREHAFGPLIIHAPYTYNLASDKPHVRAFALEAMQEDLKRLSSFPPCYYNFHPGSHVGQGMDAGIEKISGALRELLSRTEIVVLLEGMAGKGSEIGSTFEELSEIIAQSGAPENLGVCLDTCHLFEAGYDIVGDLDGVIERFDTVVGLDRLKALHINDSKNFLGAHKDRHEKIGKGGIGLEALVRCITHPALSHLPMILETPNDMSGYAEEIALLRAHANSRP